MCTTAAKIEVKLKKVASKLPTEKAKHVVRGSSHGYASRVKQGTQGMLSRVQVSLQATLTREYISKQGMLTRGARNHSRRVGT